MVTAHVLMYFYFLQSNIHFVYVCVCLCVCVCSCISFQCPSNCVHIYIYIKRNFGGETFAVVHFTMNVFLLVYGHVDWQYKHTSMLQ